jgi:Ulp1 family protease
MIFCLLDNTIIGVLFKTMGMYSNSAMAAVGASLFKSKSNTSNPNGRTRRKKNPTTTQAVSDSTAKRSAAPSPLGSFDMSQFNTKQRAAFAGMLPILAALFGR